MIGLAGNVRGRRASYLRGVQLLSVFLEGNLRVASYQTFFGPVTQSPPRAAFYYCSMSEVRID